jgi:hypothetical protein
VETSVVVIVARAGWPLPCGRGGGHLLAFHLGVVLDDADAHRCAIAVQAARYDPSGKNAEARSILMSLLSLISMWVRSDGNGALRSGSPLRG